MIDSTGILMSMTVRRKFSCSNERPLSYQIVIQEKRGYCVLWTILEITINLTMVVSS